MGEAADDMLEGRACAICGQFFKDPEEDNTIYEHGYPVACKDCWTQDCGYEQATVDTF